MTTYQALYLSRDLTPHRLGPEGEPGYRDRDNEYGSQREERVVGEGRAEMRYVIVPPARYRAPQNLPQRAEGHPLWINPSEQMRTPFQGHVHAVRSRQAVMHQSGGWTSSKASARSP